MSSHLFINRDISWLSFNERVLLEATRDSVPLLERLRFVAIFSSNLDEFYRVRMPVIHALGKLNKHKKNSDHAQLNEKGIYTIVNEIILRQSKLFGNILVNEIIPQFKNHRIHLLYSGEIPEAIRNAVDSYFFEEIAGFLEIVFIHRNREFFPVNNLLYLSVLLNGKGGKDEIALVNIPSDAISRFFSLNLEEEKIVVFIDDIIKSNLQFLFPDHKITGVYCIKITRDADLNLTDEFEGDLAEKIEKQLAKRDFGLATRFLYSPGMPEWMIDRIAERFSLQSASFVEGGEYHNLSSLANFPISKSHLSYTKHQSIKFQSGTEQKSLFSKIKAKDILIHTPYQDFHLVLRFFNEAAITAQVEEIFVTLYRIASDSRIANALISAAKNGKKVTVFVELKARFDELNNIQWAKKMKKAGVNIIYSIPDLKVHAKVALIKLKDAGKPYFLGLFATGNFNEVTASFYTDHILFTANKKMLQELNSLFAFLTERKKPGSWNEIRFRHLFIAQFNLRRHFVALIRKEISNARKGLRAGITIKLNNLEEEGLITELYKAAKAGVKINLVVRGICRLDPYRSGRPENIVVKRIVGRFLEHGRVFIFSNGGDEKVYLGSSDWMHRNIYARIEVCFPVYDQELKDEIKKIIEIQLQDNVSQIISPGEHKRDEGDKPVTEVESQKIIFEYLKLKYTDPLTQILDS